MRIGTVLALLLVTAGCDDEEAEEALPEVTIEPRSLTSADGTSVDRAELVVLFDGAQRAGSGRLALEIVEREGEAVVCRTGERSTRYEATDDGTTLYVVEHVPFAQACPEASAPNTRRARFTFRAAEGMSAVGYLDTLPPPIGAPRVAGDEELDPVRLRGECDAGNMRSCTQLGGLHYLGDRVEQNDDTAIALHRKSCDGGDLLGCSNLAVMLGEGRGADRDDGEAYRLFARACAPGGEAAGCVGLATHLLEGRGVAADPMRARAAAQLGCDAADAPSCGELGMLVLNGIGGDADVREGAELYRRSCEGGVAVACQNLGSLYVNGRPGFQTNWAEGRRYFERACLLGLEESCAYLRGD